MSLKADDVLERLSDLFVRRGVPEHIQSDNGPEFTVKAVRCWLGRVGVGTHFIGHALAGPLGHAEDRRLLLLQRPPAPFAFPKASSNPLLQVSGVACRAVIAPDTGP